MIAHVETTNNLHDVAGALWRRWDPHMHSPGTVFEDRFGGDGSWDDYVNLIENVSPKIEALGVTDYFRLDGYKDVLKQQKNGKLSGVKFIFANVELRYGIGSPKGSPINFHLLVSPGDPDHIERIENFLQSLTFKAGPSNESFRCTPSDIRRLGRMHQSSDLDDDAAFKVGANQFKISPDEFLKEWADNVWVQDNVLIAVPASSNDGTASLQGNDALAATRQKLERMSHIIFSSRQADRVFWLGQGAVDEKTIKDRYNGPKPCIHGCDAHSLNDVGKPALNRYTWIKGDPCFETLRQICMEPKDRVIVAEEALDGSLTSQTIVSVTVKNAPWFCSSTIEFNSGLVGIIGARGSGKTALADMIAAGGNSLARHMTRTSFVKRAMQPVDLLRDATVELNWADGSQSVVSLSTAEYGDEFEPERVQYLSQQFVERLCSAEGATGALIQEIERVIFNAHPQSDRMLADNFNELLEIKASTGRQRRMEYEQAISQAGAKMRVQRNLKEKAKTAKGTCEALIKQNKQDTIARDKLVRNESRQHSVDFQKVSTAAGEIRIKVESIKRRLTALDTLAEEINAFTSVQSNHLLQEMKSRHAATNLSDASWLAFKTVHDGNVDTEISNARSANQNLLTRFIGDSAAIEAEIAKRREETDSDTPASYLPRGIDDLSNVSLAILEAEEVRLRGLMALDEDKAKQHKRLSDKISATNTRLEKLNTLIADSDNADDVISQLIADRNDSYRGVFEGIIDEETQLNDLYSPVGNRLKGATGALSKLTFSINRTVDLLSWTNVGETLIDTRKAGDFKGRGSLAKLAEELLLPSWQTGDAQQAADAMAAFRAEYNDLLRHAAKADSKDKDVYLDWANKVSSWLYDTKHIRVSYGLQYEGVEIESLSPGTRGIVLLLLYLAIDTDDDRPLVIDQPEENLDPKSIYDELVQLFRGAKLRRQIIIVTHNANLVVNTDADQIIVAECGPLQGGKLPDISYTSGAIENPEIRQLVCKILEGGEDAFRDRAKRLRINALGVG